MRWLEMELNHRRIEFQSIALPPELLSLIISSIILASKRCYSEFFVIEFN